MAAYTDHAMGAPGRTCEDARKGKMRYRSVMDLDMNALEEIALACQDMAPEDCKAAILASKHAAHVRDPDALAAYLCGLAGMV